ncbi:hypothetical protein ABK040_014909 [Willaertia magna]
MSQYDVYYVTIIEELKKMKMSYNKLKEEHETNCKREIQVLQETVQKLQDELVEVKKMNKDYTARINHNDLVLDDFAVENAKLRNQVDELEEEIKLLKGGELLDGDTVQIVVTDDEDNVVVSDDENDASFKPGINSSNKRRKIKKRKCKKNESKKRNGNRK